MTPGLSDRQPSGSALRYRAPGEVRTPGELAEPPILQSGGRTIDVSGRSREAAQGDRAGDGGASQPRHARLGLHALNSAGSMDAVMCDVQREATDRVWGEGRGDPSEPRGFKVGFPQLAATLAGVRSAHAAGDRVALRGELVALASQAVVWASDLPAPIKRRTHAKAAA